MKTSKHIPAAVVVLYAVTTTLLVWSLDVICAGIVTNDSAWQALRLDAAAGSRVHLVAEAIHQVPMLGNTFGTVTIILVAIWFNDRKRKDTEQPAGQVSSEAAPSASPDEPSA